MEFQYQMTCRVCPEQYDIFDEENNRVAYFRYRHGRLTVNPYYKNSEVIDFSAIIYSEDRSWDKNSGWLTDEERPKVFERVNKALEEWLENEKERF